MKILIVGGAAQGKRERAERVYGAAPLDGGTCGLSGALSAESLDRLHLLTRRLLEREIDPVEAVLDAVSGRESWLFVCDEVGSGIVPADPFERAWREQTGRLCCALAARADRVERVVCGIAAALKGADR